jgi:glutathione S-transferase
MGENLGVEFDLKDTSENETFAQELMEMGGKRQVPFLVDTETSTSMYESSDIIDYLRENRPKSPEGQAAPKPRMHVSNAVCESCEG